MQASRPFKKPSDNNLRSIKVSEAGQHFEETPYKSLFGFLRYAVKQSRAHTVWKVIVTSKFMQKPVISNWLASKRVLCYQQATKLVESVSPTNNDKKSTGKIEAKCSVEIIITDS